MSRRASDVYEMQREPLPAWRRLPRVIVVLVTNVLSMGSGPANPGGGAIRIIEKGSGREVSILVEQMGDDGQGVVSSISADLSVMSADDFASKWL